MDIARENLMDMMRDTVMDIVVDDPMDIMKDLGRDTKKGKKVGIIPVMPMANMTLRK